MTNEKLKDQQILDLKIQNRELKYENIKLKIFVEKLRTKIDNIFNN